MTRRLTVGCSTAELLRNILPYKLSTAKTFQLLFSDKSILATGNFLRVNESPCTVKPRSVTFKYSVVVNFETFLNIMGLADIDFANFFIEDCVNKIHLMGGCSTSASRRRATPEYVDEYRKNSPLLQGIRKDHGFHPRSFNLLSHFIMSNPFSFLVVESIRGTSSCVIQRHSLISSWLTLSMPHSSL